MEKKLIWLDLEMTGLDPNAERIIEIFTAVTNEDLTEIIDGPTIVISQPQEYIDAMDDWNQTHHGDSGLIEDVLKSKVTQKEAEQETLRFLREHVKKNSSPLCGNTVWHDRKFLTLYMPELEDYFHYRCIDVSSVKELTKRWRPEISIQHSNKTAAHRAQADVYESINELRFYRDTIFSKSLESK